MRKCIEDACEGIDAALFSGDAFHDGGHRDALRTYIERWVRRLDRLEDYDTTEDMETE
jgi:hypothetical protein